MKAISKIFILFLILNSVSWIGLTKACAQESVGFQVFYDDLSPYGSWVDNSNYGYVWIPNVSSGFTPYGTDGYWVFTDAGWTWVSDYSWGWAPFHYGRWYYDNNYGWEWVPDNEWGPGWVTWRSSQGYYGWAPIGPGISLDLAYSNGYNVPNDRWRFVRDRDFGRTNINNYYVSSSSNNAIIRNSAVINNIQVGRSNNVRYNAGPNRTEAEKNAGRTFTPVAIRESNKPGQHLSKGELQLYRPQVQKNISGGPKQAPSKVASLKNIRQVGGHGNTRTQPQQKIQTNKGQQVQNQNNKQPTKPTNTTNETTTNKTTTNKATTNETTTNETTTNKATTNKATTNKATTNKATTNETTTNETTTNKATTNEQQPTRQQPTRQQPTRQQPTRQQPTRQQPTRQQPTRQQPTRQQPTRQQPTRQQPTRQQPTRQQPTKQQPTKEQQQPTKKQQSRMPTVVIVT